MLTQPTDENKMGEQLFGISYRNAPSDFDLGVKAVQRRMRLMEKVTNYFLSCLGVFMLTVCLLLAPPLTFSNGHLGIRSESISIFLFSLLFISTYGFSAIPIYLNRKRWIREIQLYPTTLFYGYENIISLFRGLEATDEEQTRGTTDSLVVAARWEGISEVEIRNDCLLLFFEGSKAIVIPNREVRGDVTFEQLCAIITARTQPSKAQLPPIASPR